MDYDSYEISCPECHYIMLVEHIEWFSIVCKNCCNDVELDDCTVREVAQMYLQVIQCLKCHNYYGEKNKFIAVCPFCKNDDTEQTIYLSPDSNIYKEFMKGGA